MDQAWSRGCVQGVSVRGAPKCLKCEDGFDLVDFSCAVTDLAVSENCHQLRIDDSSAAPGAYGMRCRSCSAGFVPFHFLGGYCYPVDPARPRDPNCLLTDELGNCRLCGRKDAPSQPLYLQARLSAPCKEECAGTLVLFELETVTG